MLTGAAAHVLLLLIYLPANGPKILFDIGGEMSKTLVEPAAGKRRRRLSATTRC